MKDNHGHLMYNTTDFTLSGLNETMDYRLFIFSLTLLCYCVILLVNVTLIVTIILDENLHDPMYILLCNLCISAIYGTAGFYPKFLSDLLSNSYVISYGGCLFQAFVIYSSACSDFSILAVMAYDRFVAICRPLEYHSVMTKQKLFNLIFYSWLLPHCMIGTTLVLSSRLPLCGLHIQKLYCSNWSVVKLACASTIPNDVFGYLAILFYFGHVIFIVCSYISLIKSCLKSIENRGKFMQTCVPHLLSLFNFTLALFFDVMYVRYGTSNVKESIRNFLAIEFLFIPPIFNPVIYGFKLTKIRNKISGFVTQKVLT